MAKNINLLNIYKNLCNPAKFYLILTTISIIIYIISMINMKDKLSIFKKSETSIHNYTISGLIMKIIFTIFWVYLLNYICNFNKYGVKIAWVIVLLPIIFLFILVLLLHLFIDDILKSHSQELKLKLSENNDQNNRLLNKLVNENKEQKEILNNKKMKNQRIRNNQEMINNQRMVNNQGMMNNQNYKSELLM
jgi:ABC-type multidrug transport system fused ATPase/permease subunit